MHRRRRARGEIGVVEQIDQHVQASGGFADAPGLRNPIDPGNYDKGELDGLVGAQTETLARRRDGRGVGRGHQDQMAQKRRGGDQLLRFPPLVPELCDRQSDRAAFEIADLERLELSKMADYKAIAAPVAAVQRNRPALLVSPLQDHHRAAGLSRLRVRVDQERKIDPTGSQFIHKDAFVRARDEFVVDPELVVIEEDRPSDPVRHFL